jgi:hypothetical protein
VETNPTADPTEKPTIGNAAPSRVAGCCSAAALSASSGVRERCTTPSSDTDSWGWERTSKSRISPNFSPRICRLPTRRRSLEPRSDRPIPGSSSTARHDCALAAAFFDRVEAADPRPGIVTAIREKRDRIVDPDVVERFAGANPRNPAALVDGLTEGFREHTQYDVARYLAGSIEDNVIFGAADLRQYFEEDVDFEALLESDTTGIFCWELVFRSIEALQSVRPVRQSIPVAACYVSDRRHKHAFTGIVSAIRVDGALRLPMTFVDYTHSTLYDDVRLTGVLGEGLAAYNDGHRADEIWW